MSDGEMRGSELTKAFIFRMVGGSPAVCHSWPANPCSYKLIFCKYHHFFIQVIMVLSGANCAKKVPYPLGFGSANVILPRYLHLTRVVVSTYLIKSKSKSKSVVGVQAVDWQIRYSWLNIKL